MTATVDQPRPETFYCERHHVKISLATCKGRIERATIFQGNAPLRPETLRLRLALTGCMDCKRAQQFITPPTKGEEISESGTPNDQQ